MQNIVRIVDTQRASPWCEISHGASNAPGEQRSECMWCKRAAAVYRSWEEETG